MSKTYFDEVYRKRVNKYGEDYSSRVLSKREKEFELMLKQSQYKVEFEYDWETQVGILTRMRQQNNRILHYLLVRTSLNIPAGEILELPNKDNELKPWMIFYLDEIKSSGYNRYITLKMSHYIEWSDEKGTRGGSSWAFLYGQENNMLIDEIVGRSRSHTVYTENLKTSFMIMPATGDIKKDDYMEITEGEITQGFRVTGFDALTQPGVMFVTIDPVPFYDLTPPEEDQPGEDNSYWFQGEGS